MARFKLTVDLYVEADSTPRAMDAAVAWIQNQGPNPCSDWRAVGTPVAAPTEREKRLRRETLTSWMQGTTGRFVVEAEQNGYYTFYRVRENGSLWPHSYASSAAAETAVAKAEQKAS